MNEMKLSDFNYELPQELIAQDPLLKRSDSRLMVLNRATGGIEHRHFSDVIEYLNPGDCLVINDTKGHSGQTDRSQRKTPEQR